MKTFKKSHVLKVLSECIKRARARFDDYNENRFSTMLNRIKESKTITWAEVQDMTSYLEVTT